MFSGGTYQEVGRWLHNFLVSHAKRVGTGIEVQLDTSGERRERCYGVQLQLAGRVTELFELDFEEVARNRGSLTWCAALAGRVSSAARELAATGG